MIHMKGFQTIVLAVVCVLWGVSVVQAESPFLTFTDGSGATIDMKEPPGRVVSLVPAITEIIFELGAGELLKGMTYHDSIPSGVTPEKIMGGFFSPSPEKIEKVGPDLIFLSSLHAEVREQFQGKAQLIELNANSIRDIYDNITIIGKIFKKEGEANQAIAAIREELSTISGKVKAIPDLSRKRTVRLMGIESVMVPGDDSFQNSYIKAAGGIPPMLNKKGDIVPVTREEWLEFNPQVIYACERDTEALRIIQQDEGWKDVDAVRQGNILYFPCDLTCRASVNAGFFVSWLSSRMYEDEFFRKENLVNRQKVFRSDPLALDLPYVADARIDFSYIKDFPNKSLVVELEEPMRVVSTLEGERAGIDTVGNHYIPPQNWGAGHMSSLDDLKKEVYAALEKEGEASSFLFTGADMKNISIQKAEFREISLYALVTAGVSSNALRMSVDEGRYYEPGTINMILLSNMKLSPRAMTRAIISATEAKTAALQDLDIRSSSQPLRYQATGTGTDNVVVVEGKGPAIDNAGGHTKVGELVAKAVYKGVREAVAKQNAITGGRSVFQRLKERKIKLSALIKTVGIDKHVRYRLNKELEEILLLPEYAAFLESAFSLSDAYESGSVSGLQSYELWCRQIAGTISGREIDDMLPLVEHEALPEVIGMAFNALLNGLFLNME